MATKIGSMKLKSDVGICGILEDILYCPEVPYNLLSVSKMQCAGYTIVFNQEGVIVYDKKGDVIISVPRTPQLNGVAERMVRTITEKARSLISCAKLNKVFWGEAVLTAVYLINITPTKALKCNKTPYELWHEKKPQIKYLKVFGSTVFVHNKEVKCKFDDKSWKGILVGYEPNGYKVWKPENEKLVIVRDVIVDEIDYLKSRPASESRLPEENIQNSQFKETDPEDQSVSTKSHVSNKLKSGINKSDEYEIPCKIIKSNHDNTSSVDKKLSSLSKPTDSHTELRRSARIKELDPVSYKNLNDGINDCLMCAQSILYEIPKCYDEIKYRSDRTLWDQAIASELQSLSENNTWVIVPKPNNKNIVDCKWIFTIKNDEFGNPVKYKARLVARELSSSNIAYLHNKLKMQYIQTCESLEFLISPVSIQLDVNCVDWPKNYVGKV
ncbi:unnamed protein product [Leptosia nina]|uniref:Integrase catalytic domain-containing protein n=1 Tax=Leptosia nina TaxID=320188 RepID=A0AAV1JKV3_9NEOP